MDPQTPGDIEATGTLPVVGEGLALPQPEPPAATRPDWIDEARANLSMPGKYLAYEESGRQVVSPLNQEWTRIGRSLAADIRLTIAP